jgi:hypothetical protein
MKERTRVRKSAEAEPQPTNRLTGITVSEVSIVDRAANQRKFLVMKEAAAAPPPPAAPPPAPAPAPPVEQLKISPELKAKVVGALRSAQEKIVGLAKQLEGALETPGAPAPQALLDALAGISGLLAATPAQQPPAPPQPPAPTAKAGKKISAARLEQLMTAKTALDTILSEVAAGIEADETPATEPEKTTKNDGVVTPGAPAVPATTPATPAAPVTPAAPPDELSEIRASMEQLAGMVGKMTLVFEGQNQRIDSLTKSRGQSQQVEIDKVTTAKSERVVWDMDMAKPLKIVQ